MSQDQHESTEGAERSAAEREWLARLAQCDLHGLAEANGERLRSLLRDTLSQGEHAQKAISEFDDAIDMDAFIRLTPLIVDRLALSPSAMASTSARLALLALINERLGDISSDASERDDFEARAMAAFDGLVPQLGPLLSDPDPEVRERCARTLSMLDDPAALAPALRRRAQRCSPRWRWSRSRWCG